MTILTDNAELRNQFKQGDPSALATIYRHYVRDLFGFLRRGFAIQSGGGAHYFQGYTRHWQLEAAVQEVFARAFRQTAREAYDGLRPFKNYLFTIGRNYVIDDFRAGKTRDRLFIPMEEAGKDLDTAQATRSQQTAETLLQDQQLRTIVEQFVAHLAPGDARVFQMRFREHRSVAATAHKLGLSEYRVKQVERGIRRRFYALARRHGYLEGYMYNEPGTHGAVFFILLLWALGKGAP